MKDTVMKNDFDDFSDFDEEALYDKTYIKSSRAKKNYQARKKIEDYLERKRLNNYHREYHKEYRDVDYELYDY